jgi:hypothetical protein
LATDDLLTAAEARRFVGLGTADATRGTLLAQYVTAASRALAKGCGTIIYGTVTGELQSGGRPYVYLDRHPVAQVVQVVEYDSTTPGTLTAETNASKPSESYVADLTSGKVTRRSGGATHLFPTGIDNVYVTYVAGRFASTATVDDRFKTACGLVLKNMWRAQEFANGSVDEFDVPQASFPRFTIPNSVKELLGDEWHYGTGTGD